MRRLANLLLPASCLLCGADSNGGALCAGCAGDLPPLSAAQCPQCAEQTTHGERCGACLKDPPAFARCSALFRYEFPVDRAIQALKYGHQLALATWFGERLADTLQNGSHDRVMPLPLHPERLRERGFNQSAEIARVLARRLRLPLDLASLARRRATPAQAALPLRERARNVRGAFECTGDLAGLRILLVDDVMTTGATLSATAAVLKDAGAATVINLVVARTD